MVWAKYLVCVLSFGACGYQAMFIMGDSEISSCSCSVVSQNLLVRGTHRRGPWIILN